MDSQVKIGHLQGLALRYGIEVKKYIPILLPNIIDAAPDVLDLLIASSKDYPVNAPRIQRYIDSV